MKKILAVASSGGHFVQLKILINSLSSEEVDIKTVSTFVSGSKGVFKTDYCIEDASARNVKNVFNIIIKAVNLVFLEKPDVILTTGALPGLLFVLVGRCFGVKTIWVDSVANPEKVSLSGKVAMRISSVTLTQWPHLETDLIKYKGGVL